MDPLDQMALIKTNGTDGKLAPLTRLAATGGIVLGGLAIAAAFFAPGLALAGALPAGAAGAHPWIVDGGPEIANNMPWRIELMLEYIAVGIAALAVALRVGHALLGKAQDWYEGTPLTPWVRTPQPVPATIFPRARQSDAANANDKHDLYAA